MIDRTRFKKAARRKSAKLGLGLFWFLTLISVTMAQSENRTPNFNDFQAESIFDVNNRSVTETSPMFGNVEKPENITCQENVLLACNTPGFTDLLDLTDVRTPQGLAIADFNGDGKLDLVTSGTATNANQVAVRFGNNDANGSFQSPVYYLAGTNPGAIAVGDLDGINGLDIAVATFTTSGRTRLAILLNQGNGTFNEVTSAQCQNNDPSCPGGADQIVNVAVGKIDGNNSLDIVVSDINSELVLIYFGSGTGTFNSPIAVNFPNNVGGSKFVTLADMDGDLDHDLVVAVGSNGPGEVHIKYNAGNGTFPSQANFIVPVSNSPSSITVADFDGIRGLDFAVANQLSNFISVKLRDASGGFSDANGSPYDLTRRSRSVTTGDFNLDGRLDLATAGNDGFSVLLGNANGSFGTPFNFTTGGNPFLVFAKDITGDNRPDLVLADAANSGNGIGLRKNTCDGGRKPFDFDGDGKTDISIFRPAPAEWWYLKSSNGGNAAAQFGATTDKITPGDFTGDGKTDFCIWRPSTGFWFILRSEDGSFFSFPFGQSGDIPAPADYDGDGKVDAAVFRPSVATWFILRSGDGGITFNQFGVNGDKPVPADYDGDGKADVAIFRPSVGEWWYQKSSTAQTVALQFGTMTDKPVPGDYTGDGKADIAFFRPGTGFWFILRSQDNSFFSFPFGASGDIPAPGDYDGDGKIDTAVFRPSNSTWFLNQTTAGVGIVIFGIAGDQPVPSVFIP